MTNEELRALSENFVKSFNERMPRNTEFKFGIGSLTEFLTCYYFDFRLLNINGEEYQGPAMGGAPGFIITKKDGQPKTISFGDLAVLDRQENEVKEIYKMLLDVKTRDTSLLKLKNKYRLTSGQLLKLKKEFERKEIDRKKSEELIVEIVNNIPLK
jgi:hypothetical protein